MRPGESLIGEVVAAIRRSDMRRAAMLAVQGLQNGVQHPLLLNVRAQWLESQGRDREALADLELAQSLAARDTGILEALGLLQLRLGMARRAQHTFERLVGIKPQYGHAHYCLGLAFEALGNLEAADRNFRTANRLEPNQAPTLGRLGSIAARRGEWVEARAFADLTLAQDGRAYDAMFVRATADLAAREEASVIGRMSALAKDHSFPPAARATALSLMGDAFDALGRSDEAFRAYQEASQNFQAGFAPQFASAERALDFVVRLREAVLALPGSSDPVEPTATISNAAGHVFLLGFPRSGTTLLERILSQHPAVVCAEEREYLGEHAATFLRDHASVRKLGTLTHDELQALRARYWQNVLDDGVDVRGKVFVDKLPLNTIKLPLICRLFPSARIVFSVRDPRDVVFSCFRRRFAMNPSMFELVTLNGAATFYDAVMTLFAACRTNLAVEPHFVRYEDLVENPDAETRRLCDALGVEWSGSLLAFAGSAASRSSATPSARQVARGLYRDGIGQWRRYASHLQGVAPVVEPWIAYWGYEP